MDFAGNPAPAIDESLFLCYTIFTCTQRRIAVMGELRSKAHISVGLLAHVGANRGEPRKMPQSGR